MALFIISALRYLFAIMTLEHLPDALMRDLLTKSITTGSNVRQMQRHMRTFENIDEYIFSFWSGTQKPFGPTGDDFFLSSRCCHI